MLELTLSPPSALAAIDLGSNSFRLEVGCVAQGRYERLYCRREMVSLSAGLDSKSRLSRESIARGLRCLRKFSRDLEAMCPSQVRVVATQTLREARNREDFLRRAEEMLGLPIEVISGQEEARLIYAGVSFLHPSTQRRLVIDIGGRSTELIAGQGRNLNIAASFQVGSASLSQRFFSEGRMSSARFRDARMAVSDALRPALAHFGPVHWDEALAASGTARMLSAVLHANQIGDGTLTPDGLAWLTDRCIEAGRVDRLQLPGLKPDRIKLLPGGLSALSAIAGLCEIRSMRGTKGALRQGTIIDMYERESKAAKAASLAEIRLPVSLDII